MKDHCCEIAGCLQKQPDTLHRNFLELAGCILFFEEASTCSVSFAAHINAAIPSWQVLFWWEA